MGSPLCLCPVAAVHMLSRVLLGPACPSGFTVSALAAVLHCLPSRVCAIHSVHFFSLFTNFCMVPNLVLNPFLIYIISKIYFSVLVFSSFVSSWQFFQNVLILVFLLLE